MKVIFFCVLILETVLFGSACQKQVKSPTDFFRDFNLGELVEQINVPELHPTSGGSGSSTAIGESTEYRRDFSLEYRIEELFGKRFDEDKFLGKLKDEIAKKIEEIDFRTEGSDSMGDSFYFTYSKSKNKGWIGIIGARLAGDKYKLWCMIRENAELENEN